MKGHVVECGDIPEDFQTPAQRRPAQRQQPMTIQQRVDHR
jgi:hypothetical protein